MVKASNVEIPEEDMLDNTTRELRSFRSAATKYLQGYDHYKRIKDDALQLKQLDPFIGTLELKQVHMGSLQDSSRSGARMESRRIPSTWRSPSFAGS
jgi:hypothetical protein